MFKKILYIILCIVDLYLCWSAIGFTITGAASPNLIGNVKAVFMGNYILAITFGILFVILTTLLVVFGIKHIKNKK